MKQTFISKLRQAYWSCKDKERTWGSVDDLVEALDEGGFFTAPCSSQYHLCKECGLLEHSLNVESVATDLAITLGYKNLESVTVAALLHDIGKMGQFGKPNYIQNFVKDGKPTKAEPEQKYKLSDSKPYITNTNLLYVDHEIRSIQIASQYIELTEEESFAILYHNGMYSNLKYALQGKETPLYMIIHWADMWASRVIEKEEK